MPKKVLKGLLNSFSNTIASRAVLILLSIFFLASMSLAIYLYNEQKSYIALSYSRTTDTITKLIYSMISSNTVSTPEQLSNFMETVGKTDSALTAIVFDASKKVLASTVPAYKGKDIKELAEIIEPELEEEITEVLTTGNPIKKTYFIMGEFETVIPFKNRVFGEGVIYTLVNFNHLQKALSIALFRQILTIIIIFILCSMAVFLLIRRLISKPMAVFIKGVEDVTRGIYKEMDLKIEINELLSLSNSFNKMLRALKHREEVIKHQNEQLSTLYWVTETFLSEKSLTRALQKILLLMSAMEGVEKKGVIFLLKNGYPVPQASIGFELSEIADKCNGRVFDCLCGKAIRSSISIHLDSTSPEHIDCLEKRPHHHFIFPIMTARKTYGVICLYMFEKPSEELKLLLNHIGEEIAVAIERYNLIQELNFTSEKLRNLNEEMRTLIHAVSHDLRNPLVSIQGYSDMLLEDLNEKITDDQKDYLYGIQRNVAYISEIIEALLKLSRIERREITPEEIDIKDFFNELYQDIKARHPDIEINLLGSNLVITSDKTLLWHIFSNILENSIKYSKPDKSAIIEIDWMEKHENIMITIKDNGIGIDREHLDKIFLPFHRATSLSEGTGLGLSIVKKSVDILYGKVWIESEKGVGTIVYVEIPKKTAADK